jgi:hypothetical protein
MSFHVGQLVVCVDDAPHFYGGKRLTKGRVYTVTGDAIDHAGDYGISVAEATARGTGYFLASRFRPVDEKRIEVFKRIAANPKIEVDA